MPDDSLQDFLETPVFRLGPISLVGMTLLERYFVAEVLSESGGMSEVYLAEDRRLNGRHVVVKVLSEALFHNAYARQKAKQEVEALLRIHHSGVVEILDQGELEDGRPFLVMQFVDGETLRSRIPTEGIPFKHASSILKQIGNALDHVHGKGILHRDLKPENVMLSGDQDQVVLIDFGIAKVIESEFVATTSTGSSAGTSAYMSPEQLRGEEFTKASDIYSLGVVAYEMITGQRPFNPTSRENLTNMQRKGVRFKPCELRADLPKQADSLILRALSFAAKDRFQNASDFTSQLANALVGTKINSPVISTRTLVWLSVLLIVAGSVSFGGYWYLTSRPSPLSRSFTYFLTVQKMHDGKPEKAPYQSHGEETFESGDNFRLTVFSPVAGYLYLFREESPRTNEASFVLVYPRADSEGGSASLGADQWIESEWFTFRSTSGNENFWMVWSTSPVAELESAKVEAFRDPNRGLSGLTLERVRNYLTTKQAETHPTTFNYKETQKAVVRAKSDLLVTLTQFKHR